MRKILYLLSLTIILFTGCAKEELNYLNDLEKGAFVYFEEEPESPIIAQDISDVVFEGTLLASGDVKQYDLFIYGNVGGLPTDTFYVGVYKKFPVDLRFTARNLALMVGRSESEVSFGDSFGFWGFVTDSEDYLYYPSAPQEVEIIDENDVVVRVDYSLNGRVDQSVIEPSYGYKDGFDFGFVIGCPQNTYDAETFPGNYAIVSGQIGIELLSSFQVISGPGINQLTLLDVFGHGYDVVLDVDPVTNEVLVQKQEAWDSKNLNDPNFDVGVVSVRGDGYLLPCTNALMLNLEHFNSEASFGKFVLQAEKI